MSNEKVMLFSAIIAAGASLLMFLLTRLFDIILEKRRERERFFYEIFPKRIELYENILKVTDFIPDKAEQQNFISMESSIEFYREKNRILNNLGVRCIVYGSLPVMNALNNINSIFGYIVSESVNFSSPKFGTLSTQMTTARLKIAELIRKESGTYLVDKKVKKYLNNTRKKIQEDTY